MMAVSVIRAVYVISENEGEPYNISNWVYLLTLLLAYGMVIKLIF